MAAPHHIPAAPPPGWWTGASATPSLLPRFRPAAPMRSPHTGLCWVSEHDRCRAPDAIESLKMAKPNLRWCVCVCGDPQSCDPRGKRRDNHIEHSSYAQALSAICFFFCFVFFFFTPLLILPLSCSLITAFHSLLVFPQKFGSSSLL